MYIATDPHTLPLPPEVLAKGCAVTIGNFDGVHHGHQKLIRRTIEKGRAAHLPSVVITFTPHPLRVVLGDKAPPMLMSLQQKLACIAGLGVDLALVLRFTAQTAATTPEEFVEDVLAKGLNTKELVVGYDYALGQGRRGDATLLAELGAHWGFGTEQLEPVYLDGAIVSSTRIRKALLDGDAAEAARLLGRPHSVEGVVIHGANRGGKLLGFPTANLRADEDLLLPKPGVYAVRAEVGDCDTPDDCPLPDEFTASQNPLLLGVANVGKNPTFGDEGLRVETFLLDFQRDIYNHRFRVHFIERLRDEVKFNGADELIRQIRLDVEQARAILSRSGESN